MNFTSNKIYNNVRGPANNYANNYSNSQVARDISSLQKAVMDLSEKQSKMNDLLRELIYKISPLFPKDTNIYNSSYEIEDAYQTGIYNTPSKLYVPFKYASLTTFCIISSKKYRCSKHAES